MEQMHHDSTLEEYVMGRLQIPTKAEFRDMYPCPYGLAHTRLSDKDNGVGQAVEMFEQALKLCRMFDDEPVAQEDRDRVIIATLNAMGRFLDF